MSKGQFHRPSGPSNPQDESIISLANRGRKYSPPEIEDNQDQEVVNNGGGGGPTDSMEKRVADLEKKFGTLEGRIDKLDTKIETLTEVIRDFALKTSERLSGIEGRITGIEKTLEHKASKSDLTPIQEKVGTIDGTVRGLPGVPAMITLVLGTVTLCLGGTAGLAFALARYLKP